ncbi:hypothetical protein [Pikeienuella sp. HZG-20]|uniref:hypothetical protein n=1 Tax=Paludibacillus litoralis TaxID=3133267 RepID=UPI0030EF6930
MAEPRKLVDFGELTPAEQKVLDELDSGEATILGDGERPEAGAGPDRRIRPAFLRWCALGAGEGRRVHEAGLRVEGALIANGEAASRAGWKPHLDLDGCSLGHDLVLVACRFIEAPRLRSTSLQNLILNESALPGLLADRLHAKGSVFMRRVETVGDVRLLGAEIGVDLDFTSAKLSGAKRAALYADGLHAEGGILLGKAETAGEVRLVGVKIGGDLVCEGAKLSNPDGHALNAGGAQVTGVFFLRREAEIEGALDLTGAQFGAINDDPSCWPAPGELSLNRCRYGAFTGGGIDAPTRICWLGLQDPARYSQNFWPQPWEHCAQVLREMGHAEDARAVLIDKERLQRAARRRKIGARWRRWPRFVIDKILDATVRFGHQPLRAFWLLFLLWVLGVATFSAASHAGAMKPNNADILRAPEWVGCAESAPPWMDRGGSERVSQLDCFLRQPEAQGFPAFNALIYSADVLFPLVDIEQQSYWTPNEDMAVGMIAKGMMYFYIILGWALSLLAVAGFSGLVKSD